MATQNSNAGKQSKSSDAKREAPARTPEESPSAEASAVEAYAVEAFQDQKAAEPAPTPVPVTVERKPSPQTAVVASVAESADAENFAAAFEFDAGLWSRKTFELWAENASAFLDFAEMIARAKSFDEVVELQSQFAGERFAALVRQSQELMEFAQSFASLSAAPLCEARKAA